MIFVIPVVPVILIVLLEVLWLVTGVIPFKVMAWHLFLLLYFITYKRRVLNFSWQFCSSESLNLTETLHFVFVFFICTAFNIMLYYLSSKSNFKILFSASCRCRVVWDKTRVWPIFWSRLQAGPIWNGATGETPGKRTRFSQPGDVWPVTASTPAQCPGNTCMSDSRGFSGTYGGLAGEFRHSDTPQPPYKDAQ